MDKRRGYRLRNGNQSWQTENEIEFLRHIGTGKWNPSRESGLRGGADRSNMIKGYVRALTLRSDWGELDRGRIVRYANGLLRRMK